MLGERGLTPGGARQDDAGDEWQEARTERQKRRITLLRRAVYVRVNLLNTRQDDMVWKLVHPQNAIYYK